MKIVEFEMDRYREVFLLWKSDPGIGLSTADEEEPIRRFLERNPGSSFLALLDGRVAGTVLCGNDGRRGYVHHLFVSLSYRKRGIASALMEAVFKRLRELDIEKCHLFVYRNNSHGKDFWAGGGWTERIDLAVFSRELE